MGMPLRNKDQNENKRIKIPLMTRYHVSAEVELLGLFTPVLILIILYIVYNLVWPYHCALSLIWP